VCEKIDDVDVLYHKISNRANRGFTAGADLNVGCGKTVVLFSQPYISRQLRKQDWDFVKQSYASPQSY
jgi:hypothetical protein